MKKLILLPIIIAFVFLLVAKFPTYAVAPVGNYLVLIGGYVKTTNSDGSIPSTFSFKASINPNSVSGKQIILSIGDKNSSKLYYEVGINGGSLSLDYNYNGSHTSMTAGNLTAGTWQDIDIEISSTQTKLFIDGTAVFAPLLINNLGPISPDIVLGDSYKESFFDSKPYKGLIDEVSVSHGSALLLWHLDETRGATVANDSSGNNLNGTLIGGDNAIHFFGVLPTPTPIQFGLPPINWTRPVLPTLSFPFPTISNPFPTSTQPPPENNPTPTISSVRNFPRRSF